MGPLQLALTWYKSRHTGKQIARWVIQNKGKFKLSCFALDVPVRNLLSSRAVFFLFTMIVGVDK